MTSTSTNTTKLLFFMFMLCASTKLKTCMCVFFNNGVNACDAPPLIQLPVTNQDVNLLQFAENLEYLEAEFFLYGAFGFGLDILAPELLVSGGPPPFGGRKANLDNLTQAIITEFGYQEIGHLRALKQTVGLIPRPLLNISAPNFNIIAELVLGRPPVPPFDPYKDSLSYMLTSYVIPYLGLVGYVGANPLLTGYKSKRLLAGLLGVEAGQDAVIRTYLFERRNTVVEPYNITVAEATNRVSVIRNQLAKCGIKDEGLVVPQSLGAEGKIATNVLSADSNSLSYGRTPAEILRVVYGTGDENVAGGFYPNGANGKIAREYLNL